MQKIAAKWGKEQGNFCCSDEDSQLAVLLDTLNPCFLDMDVVMLIGNCHLKKVCNAACGNVSISRMRCSLGFLSCLHRDIVLRLCRLCYLTAPCQVLLTMRALALKPFMGGTQHCWLGLRAFTEGVNSASSTTEHSLWFILWVPEHLGVWSSCLFQSWGASFSQTFLLKKVELQRKNILDFLIYWTNF